MLFRSDDRKSAAGIPGLSEVPGAGVLFGTRKSDRQKTEIVLLITPRIVRSTMLPALASTTLLPKQKKWYYTHSTKNTLLPLPMLPMLLRIKKQLLPRLNTKRLHTVMLLMQRNMQMQHMAMRHMLQVPNMVKVAIMRLRLPTTLA